MQRCQVCNRKFEQRGLSQGALSCPACVEADARRREVAEARRLAPAEAFPLCEYLREEIDAQGYTADEFCRRVAIPEERLRHLIEDGDARILIHEAEQIGRVLDVNPEVFLRLQIAYRKWKDGRQ